MKKTFKIILLVLAGVAAFIVGLGGSMVYMFASALKTTNVYQESGPAAMASLQKIVLIENFQELTGVESYSAFLFQDGLLWYRFNCGEDDIQAIARALQLSEPAEITAEDFRDPGGSFPMDEAGKAPVWWTRANLEGRSLYQKTGFYLIYDPAAHCGYLLLVDT